MTRESTSGNVDRRRFLQRAGAAVGAGTVLPLSGSGVEDALASTGSGAAAARSGRIPKELRPGGEYDQLVKHLAATDQFSGTVLLVHRHRTVLSRSFGMADKQLSIPNGPDTIFPVGSITKMFTGIAIAQLVQQGKVAYSENLGTYLDGFPPEIADTVTVHQLLTHTSGVGRPANRHTPIPGEDEWDSVDELFAGTLEFIRGLPLAFTPGSAHQYSNDGYFVLGAIVARTSGQSYYDYIRKHILQRSGMTGTDFYTAQQWRNDRRIAHPHVRDESGRWVDIVQDAKAVGSPAGGAFATAADLVRFTDAVTEHKLLDPANTYIAISPKLPLGPRFATYAPGAQLMNGQWVLGHNGATTGLLANHEWFPESDWVAIFCSNYHLLDRLDLVRSLGKPRQYITGAAS